MGYCSIGAGGHSWEAQQGSYLQIRLRQRVNLNIYLVIGQWLSALHYSLDPLPLCLLWLFTTFCSRYAVIIIGTTTPFPNRLRSVKYHSSIEGELIMQQCVAW